MLTTLFIISLSVCLILVLRLDPISNTLARGDVFIIRQVTKAYYWFGQNKEKTFFFVLIHIPNYMEKIFLRFKLRANKKYHDILGSVRGKHELKMTHPSGFMRDLSK